MKEITIVVAITAAVALLGLGIMTARAAFENVSAVLQSAAQSPNQTGAR